ncbi:MAG: DUF4339 domain-containing protein [Verrucomicrobiota bacterium]
MDWYYEGNGEQQGPVPEAVLIDLYHQGKLTGDSRVWRQGMSDWDTISEAFPNLDQVICSGCNEYVYESSIIPAGDLSVCPSCKDAVLQKMREGIPLTQDASLREIREKHLKHEASIRSIGLLYYLGGGAALLLTVGMIFAFTNGGIPGAESVTLAVLTLFYGVMMVALFWVGYGFRRLKPWVKVPGGILAGIGLLGFPLGTAINAYVLYLLLSKKGKRILSKDYREIIEATPNMKYRSRIALLLLIVISLILLSALFISNGPN